MRVDFLPSARADIVDISEYIARSNPDAADRMGGRIYAAVERLETFPESAPERPQIGPSVRSLVVGNYLPLHRVEPDRVDIVRVVHASRDVGGLLEK